ncbi:hypothetical protein MKW98_013284 [Papaver atlanticum]|uniref:Uncharacterized protein n=1 Tax=Papaver atlanticum TaxID=357466 RepID=A0AAD4XF78_9MAGN|nr:hypothetical protein MKW98_013284 [Papaver atlanticum]
MVENPSQVPSSNQLVDQAPAKTRSTTSSKRRKHPHVNDDHADGNVEVIECSDDHCSSCTANAVADCIAVCCCPCAIVNMFILAFVKVPWMMGRKCCRFVKKKGKMLGKSDDINGTSDETKVSSNSSSTSSSGGSGFSRREYKDVVIERERSNTRRERVMLVDDEKLVEFSSGLFVNGNGDDGQQQNFCARFEAEKVWLELYQLGHLGFGRVSFTGISTHQGKAN